MRLILINMYSQLDENKDGHVTVAEFKKAMQYATLDDCRHGRVRIAGLVSQRARGHSRFLQPTLELRREGRQRRGRGVLVRR